MGLAQYYRAYVRNFGEILAPLTQMLRRGEKVKPTEARLKAFERLKGHHQFWAYPKTKLNMLSRQTLAKNLSGRYALSIKMVLLE